MTANSTLDTNYLKVYSYAHADEVNATVLSELMEGFDTGDMGSVFVIPTNLTDFDLTITLAFNATSGLFRFLNLKIRSISWQEEFSDNFDVDIRYALYVPIPTTPTTPTTPTPTDENAFPWGISTLASIVILGGFFYTKRKRNH